jgi:hypothetical protein
VPIPASRPLISLADISTTDDDGDDRQDKSADSPKIIKRIA